MTGGWSRDRVAGLAVPPLLTVILVPFRAGFPSPGAALALILVVVAVGANGYRLAGVLAAVSASTGLRPGGRGYLEGLTTAARAARDGGSPTALTGPVCGQLPGLLSLAGCRFQDGIAGIGSPARLLRDVAIVSGGLVWDVERAFLPAVISSCWPGAGAACCRDGSCLPLALRRGLP
jgi:hypothetical protein